MSEEDIQKIARKYAELNPPECKDEALRLTGITLNAEMVFEPFLNWLCEEYCIVSKTEIITQHTAHMQRMREVSSNRQMNRAKAIALENIFGKELFEQKGE